MEGATNSDHVSPISVLRKDEEANRQLISDVFTKPVQPLLLVAVPEIDRNTFSLDVAKQRRYPCFPPYGPGVLIRCVEAAGYTVDIIDLQYEILCKVVKTKDGEFDFDS